MEAMYFLTLGSVKIFIPGTLSLIILPARGTLCRVILLFLKDSERRTPLRYVSERCKATEISRSELTLRLFLSIFLLIYIDRNLIRYAINNDNV